MTEHDLKSDLLSDSISIDTPATEPDSEQATKRKSRRSKKTEPSITANSIPTSEMSPDAEPPAADTATKTSVATPTKTSARTRKKNLESEIIAEQPENAPKPRRRSSPKPKPDFNPNQTPPTDPLSPIDTPLSLPSSPPILKLTSNLKPALELHNLDVPAIFYTELISLLPTALNSVPNPAPIPMPDLSQPEAETPSKSKRRRSRRANRHKADQAELSLMVELSPELTLELDEPVPSSEPVIPTIPPMVQEEEAIALLGAEIIPLPGAEDIPLPSKEEIPPRKSRSARRRKANQKAKLLAQAEKQAELVAEKQVEAETNPDNVEIMADFDSDDDATTEASKKTKKASTGLRKMLISVLEGDQVEVVLTEDGKLMEYYVEMQHHAKIRGNIYKGVISNIDVNLQAAFVNYGKTKNGFLQIDEVHPEYYLQVHEPAKGRKYPPIQKVLKPGQEVLVQVVKEPNGSKGAFLTTWASLAGRFLVLTPGQEQIGISRKVEEGEERNRLREMIKGLDPGPGLGVIVRTVSAGTSKTTLQKDLNFLKRLWKDIRKKATTEKPPCLIYQEPDLATRAIRDYLSDDITEVWVDNEKTADAIREMASLLFPRKHDLVHMFVDGRKTMWERFGLLGQLEEVHAREVIMPSGGRLVFDQTEALMAIDINSGKISGKGNFETMSHRTNMEAANVIANQLRLRDIGGQIVIDFIEMRDPEHCRLVEKELRNAMKLDRARHDIGKISSFGLMEIVRQRTGTSAISITLETCPHCKGTGQRRNLEWQAVQALRDIHKAMRAAKLAEQAECVYPMATELAMYLLNHKKERLCFLEKDFHLKLTIKAE